MADVYFIGAGPGDPELITMKGRRLLDAADLVIYAGSLVNPALLEDLQGAVLDSAAMNLDEIVEHISSAVKAGKTIVRLHTGDPALYGAITEQIDRLHALGISTAIVPGVSSAFAGAAALGQELTIPEVSQTVILTRMEGRTPVPLSESLRALAQHRSTMVIFLSVGMAEQVQDELLTAYAPETPIAIVEKASWPDQRVIRGRLRNLARLVTDAGIKKTALIYVGNALKASETQLGKESKLYNKNFRHGYRDRS
ncbi:MAG TPA: precorrin-4 C(11)-methyltransferase [Dissulfurispiraceae bacterium]|nr:precorrin-4 C(11)-methyltransferase [Dissulfurispiraceae bacterium]